MALYTRRLEATQSPGTSLALPALILPQVERLETKVVNPLKLYGTQIKQTRVSKGTAECLGLDALNP